MSSTSSHQQLVKDTLFAPLDEDLHLARIAGGNESEVYLTDDQRYVVKVKSDDDFPCDGTLDTALADGAKLLAAANRIADAVGSQHSIPTYVLVGENDEKECHPVVVQPFLQGAKPLFDVDYGGLCSEKKKEVRRQLMDIVRRSVSVYLREGWMPDLYGRTSASKGERTRSKQWHMLPWRIWSFLIQRNLLRSHNLMLTPDMRVVLVDYDPMPHGKLYQLVYYNVRMTLFVRDLVLVWAMLLMSTQTSRE